MDVVYCTVNFAVPISGRFADLHQLHGDAWHALLLACAINLDHLHCDNQQCPLLTVVECLDHLHCDSLQCPLLAGVVDLDLLIDGI